MQQTHVQQYVLIYTEKYHVVQCMKDVHTKNTQHVQCVPKCLAMILIRMYTHGNSLCYYRHLLQNFMISSIYQQ